MDTARQQRPRLRIASRGKNRHQSRMHVIALSVFFLFINWITKQSVYSKAGDEGTPGENSYGVRNGNSRIQVQLEEDGGDGSRQNWTEKVVYGLCCTGSDKSGHTDNLNGFQSLNCWYQTNIVEQRNW